MWVSGCALSVARQHRLFENNSWREKGMKDKDRQRPRKWTFRKIVLVVASVIVGAPTLFTLGLLTWDGGFAVSPHQALVPGVQLNLRTVVTARGPVQYDLYGTKGPVVLSLHAGLGGADQGRLFASFLQGDGFRILSPSRPGYLGTPLSSGKTLEEQADLFAALLDTLKIEKVGVLSASSAGPVAYMFAARHPERIWGLVAIDTVSRPNPGGTFGGSGLQTAFLDAVGQKLAKLTAQISLQSVVAQTLDETAHFSSAQKDQRVAYIMNTPRMREFFEALFDTTFPYDQRRVGTNNDAAQSQGMQSFSFARITAPSFIVHGTQDGDVPFAHGVYASEHIPGAEHYWMVNGGHLDFWLSPDAEKAQDAVRTFLRQHAPVE
jgi:pimeloyl-ACP methyl ester carboxylesterase